MGNAFGPSEGRHWFSRSVKVKEKPLDELSKGWGRVGEGDDIPSMEIPGTASWGGKGRCCNSQSRGHSFPPTPQEDMTVLLPLPSAQGLLELLEMSLIYHGRQKPRKSQSP